MLHLILAYTGTIVLLLLLKLLLFLPGLLSPLLLSTANATDTVAATLAATTNATTAVAADFKSTAATPPQIAANSSSCSNTVNTKSM